MYTHLIVVSTDDIVDLYKLLDADEVKFSSRRLNRCHDLQMCRGSNCFIYGREKNGQVFTLACSRAASDIFSASLARRSFSFNENMATERALLIRLCLTRLFLAASSAAIEIMTNNRK